MLKVIGLFLGICLVFSVQAQNQAEQYDGDSIPEPIKGHLNFGFQWGLSSVSNASDLVNDTLTFPVANVPIFAVGYQYASNEKLAINSVLFVGLHPFKFNFVDDESPSFFGQKSFAMPYFGASFHLNRFFPSGNYLGLGIEFHLNTTKPYNHKAYADNNSGVVESIYFRRNLQEYSGVQRGGSICFGHEIQSGAFKGLDAFLFANYLDRAKLSVEYAANREKFFTKVSYKGNVVGIGLRYHLRKF